MYFWKIENLKEDIKNNNLTEKSAFIYALVYLVLCAISTEAMVYLPAENPNMWDAISSVAYVSIVLAGTIYAFMVNNSPNFLNRFFSLNFVLGIRFMAALIPIVIVIIVVYAIAFPDVEEIQTTPIESFIMVIWLVVYYWRLSVHIRDVNYS